MLDVITDFWKPVKKNQRQEKPDVDNLQIGSSVTFGYVPQALLSGRKMKISAINTYQFNDERIVSYLLAEGREDTLSMIAANTEGEPFLAISRRIPFAERMKMFDPMEMEAIIDQADMQRLMTRDVDSAWKHWIMPAYKKETTGVKGTFTRGDYRQGAAAAALTQPFEYTLLISENHEHALEIEKYADGRVEVYATIYRRLEDLAEVENPGANEPPRLNLAPPVLEMVKSETGVTEPVEVKMPFVPPFEPLKPESLPPEKAARVTVPPIDEVAAMVMPSIAPAPQAPVLEPQRTDTLTILPVNNPTTTETPMQFAAQPSNANGVYSTPNLQPARSGASPDQENDVIECDLHVANKIIDEAIRSEKSLSEVVRRVAGLPLAKPDSVHIPVYLSDEDFKLLANRYNLPAADRNAIKARIVEEMADFSGSTKK